MKKIIWILFVVQFICNSVFGQWKNYKIENEQSSKNDVRSICFDRGGKMCIGTWYGVYKQESDQWLIQGVENIYVNTVFIDCTNTLWVGTWGGGIYKAKEGEEWKQVKEACPSISANIITTDRKGDLWVGTFDGGVTHFNGWKWISYKVGDGTLGDNSVQSIASDSKNRIWIGTNHGLSMFDGTTWTLYNEINSPLPDNDVYSLCADRKGNLWIGTCNGLAIYNSKKRKIYKNETGKLPTDLILSIAEDVKGNIWFGTNKGVTVYNGKVWTNYTVENSNLPDNCVQTITVHNGKVYCGTGSGVSVFLR
jgi:ligand-binding sensor domain-containing protein